MAALKRVLPLLAFMVAAVTALSAMTAYLHAARPAGAPPPVALAQGSEASSLPDSIGDLESDAGDRAQPTPAPEPTPQPTPEPTPPPTPQPTARPATRTPGQASVVLRVPVLMYHYISAVPENQKKDRFAVDLRVPPELFEQHLAHLKAAGYATITTPHLWEALNRRAALPPKPVILSFDDGYADAYANALPLLQKYGFRGTFFITVNLIGRPGYMTWDQVRALDQAGMDVQSHAMDHKPMSSFSLAGLAYQMGEARKTLMGRLGHDVRFFAYPAGDYNATAVQGATNAGYFGAFAKSGGSLQSVDWSYALRRQRVGGYASVDTFKVALSR